MSTCSVTSKVHRFLQTEIILSIDLMTMLVYAALPCSLGCKILLRSLSISIVYYATDCCNSKFVQSISSFMCLQFISLNCKCRWQSIRCLVLLQRPNKIVVLTILMFMKVQILLGHSNAHVFIKYSFILTNFIFTACDNVCNTLATQIRCTKISHRIV